MIGGERDNFRQKSDGMEKVICSTAVVASTVVRLWLLGRFIFATTKTRLMLSHAATLLARVLDVYETCSHLSSNPIMLHQNKKNAYISKAFSFRQRFLVYYRQHEKVIFSIWWSMIVWLDFDSISYTTVTLKLEQAKRRLAFFWSYHSSCAA